MIEADIQAAIAELRKKSKADIETETALKWGYRAIAAHVLHLETTSLQWLLDAHAYEHEALEHASEVSGELVDAIRDGIRTSVNTAVNKRR